MNLFTQFTNNTYVWGATKPGIFNRLLRDTLQYKQDAHKILDPKLRESDSTQKKKEAQKLND